MAYSLKSFMPNCSHYINDIFLIFSCNNSLVTFIQKDFKENIAIFRLYKSPRFVQLFF
jgi:hypothetical protein